MTDKAKAKEVQKALNEAKKSGKLSPNDEKKLDKATEELKRAGQ